MMATEVSSKILLVDDEQGVLDAFQRQLRGRFAIETAASGAQALQIMEAKGGFAVVISDMQMPSMNGVEFLQAVQERTPETIRIMLTGNGDQETAVRAVNEGNIFRFLNKPCSSAAMEAALHDALANYRVARAEGELLENTLKGSVALLSELLSLTDPHTFGEAQKFREPVRLMGNILGLATTLDIELAAMFASIGAVTLPAAILQKLRARVPLEPAEEQIVQRIPAIGSSLIAHIPRLSEVSRIVLYQNKHFDGSGFPNDDCKGEAIPLGARMLKILFDLFALESHGMARRDSLGEMTRRRGVYDQRLFKAVLPELARFDGAIADCGPMRERVRETVVSKLLVGELLMGDVETTDGVLIAPRGIRVTETLLHRLKNYATFIGIKEPLLVDDSI